MACLGERELALALLILEYRRRGWGTYRIGRVLWPSMNPRTAQKRVQRFLAKLEKLGVPVDSPEEALGVVRAGRSLCLNTVETGSHSFDESRRRRPGQAEDDSRPLEPEGMRLGRTQRLVAAALRAFGGRARFSAIVNEVLELMGLEAHAIPRARLRNRVWQALRRLARRGLVGFHNGVYWLGRELGGAGIVVENFRVRSVSGRVVQVWSKRDTGRAASLEEALTLATLRGGARTVQIELATLLPSDLGRLMDEYGVSIIKIYRDPAPPYKLRPKLEISLERPPAKPHIAEYHSWTSLFARLQEALTRLLRDGGFVVVSQSRSGLGS